MINPVAYVWHLGVLVNMAKTTYRKPADSKRAFKRQTAGQLARALTEKAIRQKGFMRAEIVTKWPAIVGPEFADSVMPVSLKFPQHKKTGAVLEVRTHSAFAPILQQSQHRILDKINIYFGYGAVARITIKQGVLLTPKVRPIRLTKALSEDETHIIDQVTGEKAESDLGKAVRTMLTTVLETKKT